MNTEGEAKQHRNVVYNSMLFVVVLFAKIFEEQFSIFKLRLPYGYIDAINKQICRKHFLFCFDFAILNSRLCQKASKQLFFIEYEERSPAEIYTRRLIFDSFRSLKSARNAAFHVLCSPKNINFHHRNNKNMLSENNLGEKEFKFIPSLKKRWKSRAKMQNNFIPSISLSQFVVFLCWWCFCCCYCRTIAQGKHQRRRRIRRRSKLCLHRHFPSFLSLETFPSKTNWR